MVKTATSHIGDKSKLRHRNGDRKCQNGESPKWRQTKWPPE